MTHHPSTIASQLSPPRRWLALPLLCAATAGAQPSASGPPPDGPAAQVGAPTPTAAVDDTGAPGSTKADTAGQAPPERSAQTLLDASAAPATPPPAGSKISFSLQFNLDYTSAYYFRGILQQDDGLILQPYAKFSLNLVEQEDFKVDAFLSTWNSFGRNAGDNTSDFQRYWYESDIVGGVAITKGKFTFSTSYIFYTSPSDAFQTVQEVDLSLAFDDGELLGPFALHPYVLVAIETGNDYADGADTSRGTYLELGIAPGFSMDVGRLPIAISFPMTLGLSLNGYYESPASGIDETYGYFQVGGKASIPLPFGERFGAWTLNAGVYGLFLGSSLTEFNHGDDSEVIATVGIQVNF